MAHSHLNLLVVYYLDFRLFALTVRSLRGLIDRHCNALLLKAAFCCECFMRSLPLNLQRADAACIPRNDIVNITIYNGYLIKYRKFSTI